MSGPDLLQPVWHINHLMLQQTGGNFSSTLSSQMLTMVMDYLLHLLVSLLFLPKINYLNSLKYSTFSVTKQMISAQQYAKSSFIYYSLRVYLFHVRLVALTKWNVAAVVSWSAINLLSLTIFACSIIEYCSSVFQSPEPPKLILLLSVSPLIESITSMPLDCHDSMFVTTLLQFYIQWLLVV